MNKQELLNKLEAIEHKYKGMSYDAKSQEDYIYASGLLEATSRIIKLVKDDEDMQPEYSRIEHLYQCGKKPRWNIGDTLAFYEVYSDSEGEYELGKVTKVKFDEEQCDWVYTFEDGSAYDEESLLVDQTYKL
jgi:hypothetical protein